MRVDTCAERIRKGLSIRNMKAVELCSKTGIPKSAMSQYINNKFEPKQDRVYLIAKALDVSEAWLMGYDVPMERAENASAAQPRTAIEMEACGIQSEKAIKIPFIIEKYNKLNDNGKQKANEYIIDLSENPNYVENYGLVAKKKVQHPKIKKKPKTT